MRNTNCDVRSIVIDAVWPVNYTHFDKLADCMDKTNKIDFSCLWLSEPSIKRIRTELNKNWFIRKCKISEDVWYAWYVNPYICNKDNKKNDALSKIFSKSENLRNKKWEDIIENLLKILY